MTTKETLEALIPAIMEIEGGYYENICFFISDANAGLERIGSPYRYKATSKICSAGTLAEGEYVNIIEVVQGQ